MDTTKEQEIARPELLVQFEELEDLLDVMDICSIALRHESQVIGEYVDELATMCADSSSFDTPIENAHDTKANTKMQRILVHAQIATPEQLSEACGVDNLTCAKFLGDPVGCKPEIRRAVIAGLEEKSGERLWSNDSNTDAGSVGAALYLWLRDYFMTPFQFASKAIASKLKSGYVGAVSSLTDAELSALNDLDPLDVLRDAAANPSRYECPKSTQ